MRETPTLHRITAGCYRTDEGHSIVRGKNEYGTFWMLTYPNGRRSQRQTLHGVRSELITYEEVT